MLQQHKMMSTLMSRSIISPSMVDASEMMESSEPDDGGAEYSNYGVIMFISVLVIILVITLLSFICTRIHLSGCPRSSFRSTPTTTTTTTTTSDPFTTTIMGLDEATLNSYPKLLYSQAKVHNHKEEIYSCCSICLGDYKESDLIRLLPDCGHLFHQKCVDAWLRSHPTCPICRNSPVPSPLPTPLAEVAPLATAR